MALLKQVYHLSRDFIRAARFVLVVLSACAGCHGQISVAVPNASLPLLGFTTNAASDRLIPISGTIRSTNLDQSIPLPGGSSHVFLPPGQRYALLQADGMCGLGIWDFKDSIYTLPFKDVCPTAVVFSATGTAAAVEEATLTVISGLPAHPEVRRAASWDSSRTVLAVSDDGLLVVAAGTNGETQLLRDRGSEVLSRSVQAAIFVPQSHDLVMSDPRSNEIVLLHEAAETLLAPINADAFAFSKDRNTLVALDRKRMSLYAIEMDTLRTNKVALPLPFVGLAPLRDGRSFVLLTKSARPLGLFAPTFSNVRPSLTLVSK